MSSNLQLFIAMCVLCCSVPDYNDCVLFTLQSGHICDALIGHINFILRTSTGASLVPGSAVQVFRD